MSTGCVSLGGPAAAVGLLHAAGPATAQAPGNLAAGEVGGPARWSRSARVTPTIGGGPDFSQDSCRRAEAVKCWLRIGEVRPATVGHGLTRAVADHSTEDGHAQNRRVERLRR